MGSRSRSGGGSNSRSSSSSSRARGSSSSGSYSSSRNYSYGGLGGFSGGYGYSSNRSYNFGGGSSIGTPVHYGRPAAATYKANAIKLIAILMIVASLICVFIYSRNSGPKSTIVREKIESAAGYNYNCIKDELGWFDSKSQTGRELEYFYNKTGVQPFIYLKGYDPALTNLQQKEEYAKQYYEENFKGREDVFLYVYFAEADQDGEVGDEAWWIGGQAGSIMDGEAMDIFWHKLDALWYGSGSTDDMFVKTFTHTADQIMKVDNGPWVAIIAIMLVAGTVSLFVFIFAMTKEKNRRAKEEAEETERILKTDIDKLAESSGDEDLVNKYS